MIVSDIHHLHLLFQLTLRSLTESVMFFQFFALDVYNSDGTALTADQLYVQLERICSAALQTNTEPIGILTTQHRDSWGKAYVNLMKGELKDQPT